MTKINLNLYVLKLCYEKNAIPLINTAYRSLRDYEDFKLMRLILYTTWEKVFYLISPIFHEKATKSKRGQRVGKM